jgi:twitching motility protein PilI
MSDSSSRLRSPFGVSTDDSARKTHPQPVSQSAAATRRERLREFQASLSEKLRRAQTAPLASNRLGLQIGQRRLLIDLADAGEILTVPDITPVPLTHAWYRGLANVRGNLIGIVDLSLFAGGPATPIDKESRVLAFASELRFSTGVLVSRMLGLRSAADLNAASGTGTGHTVPGADLYAPWTRARLIDAQDVLWDELDLAALTSDERFLKIGRF